MLFFQDEARFGRINNLQRCWVPPQSRAIVGKQLIREYVYAYTAICPENGESFSLIMPYANTESMNIFLSEFSKNFKDYRIILAMDRASWHKSKGLMNPENIRFLLIPPYSPELNPVEHIWDYIREKFFNNHVYKKLDYVVDNLCIALNHLYSVKNEMISLTLFNWIYSAL